MLLDAFFMQGEEARWETFKRAEQEGQRRAGLRDDASGGRRLRRLRLRRRNLAKGAAPGVTAHCSAVGRGASLRLDGGRQPGGRTGKPIINRSESPYRRKFNARYEAAPEVERLLELFVRFIVAAEVTELVMPRM